jgi:hypothetical protein
MLNLWVSFDRLIGRCGEYWTALLRLVLFTWKTPVAFPVCRCLEQRFNNATCLRKASQIQTLPTKGGLSDCLISAHDIDATCWASACEAATGVELPKYYCKTTNFSSQPLRGSFGARSLSRWLPHPQAGHVPANSPSTPVGASRFCRG